MTVVFFEMGNTLGNVWFSPLSQKLQGLDVHLHIPIVLNKLRNNGLRLGVIFNSVEGTPESIEFVLKRSGVLKYFETDLLICNSTLFSTPNSVEVFKIAAQKAGCLETPELCLYVSDDQVIRNLATKAGFQVAEDPISVLKMFHYVKKN